MVGVDQELAVVEEERNVRRVRLIVDAACAYAASGRLAPDRIQPFIEDVKRAVLKVFPEREDLFELLYRPRLERAARYTPTSQ